MVLYLEVTHIQLCAANCLLGEKEEKGVCLFMASPGMGQAACPSQILQAFKLLSSMWGWQDWAREPFLPVLQISQTLSDCCLLEPGKHSELMSSQE